MNKTRPTLKDVAEVSGYSVRAVKKVLSGTESVRDSTKEAVLRAVDELGYRRNLAASALAKNKTVRIAVVYARWTDAYFPEVEMGFHRADEEFLDLGLVLDFYVTPQRGWKPQKKLLDEILENNTIDGVIIQPFSATMLNNTIDALVDAGKPVVTFGADAPDSKRLCYVGPDAYQAGRIGAQVLANYIGKRGNVFVINEGRGHMQTQERSRGFIDRMNEHYPNINVFDMTLPNNTDLYYEMVYSILTNEHVSGIFCTDANTYIAGMALKSLKNRDISLVGFDLSETGIQLMREGYIKVIIEQKPDVFSYLATKILFQYLTERIVPEIINKTPLYITTSECID